MKLFPLIMLLALPAWSSAQPPLALTHVTIIDVAGGPTQLDMTVLVRGGRIDAIGKAAQTAVPDDAGIVDATGKFLIPGLWDMHAHLVHERFLDLCIAHGVTGARHMFCPPLTHPATIKAWQKEVEAGKKIGPRIIAACRVLDGDKPVSFGDVVRIKDAAAGREAVQRMKREGEDFIKVYSGLKRDAYFAILDEAGREKLPVAGHVPHLISAVEASDKGQKSFEHCYSVLLGCSSDEEKLRQELAGLAAGGHMDRLDAASAWRTHVKALDTYDEKKAAALFAKFVQNGTWQVPTLTVRRAWASLQVPSFIDDERKKQLPIALRDGAWLHLIERGTVHLPALRIRLTAADIEGQKALFRGELKLIKSMHDAKVKLLAGTDTPVPYCFPGSGVHDELELLVEAGLSPLEALRTATSNPAEYLGVLKERGTIETNKAADLVLLAADPLKDIKNTRRIEAVVVRGRYLDRASLDKLRDGK
jgi:hypothetical protein